MQAEAHAKYSHKGWHFPHVTQLVMFGGIVNATKYPYITAFSEYAIPH